MSAETDALLGADTVLGHLHRRDPRLIVYACTVVEPSSTITLDLTQLVSAEAVEDWWIWPDGAKIGDPTGTKLCAAARTRLSTLTGMPPLRLLTEGSTDAEFIRAGIDLLRPDIADLVQFLNPAAKPEHSASALARMINHYGATAVTDPIVGLFDNDKAGHRELRNVQQAALPANIRVTTLPDSAVAQQYPTCLRCRLGGRRQRARVRHRDVPRHGHAH